MAVPPQDGDGHVQPHDDHQILPDDARVMRKIQRSWMIPTDGFRRLSKGAFSETSKDRDPYQGMSVDMLDLLERDGFSLECRLAPEHIGAVALRVGDLRSLDLMVGPDPGRSGDAYHANVWGVTNNIRKKILRVSYWIVGPRF